MQYFGFDRNLGVGAILTFGFEFSGDPNTDTGGGNELVVIYPSLPLVRVLLESRVSTLLSLPLTRIAVVNVLESTN